MSVAIGVLVSPVAGSATKGIPTIPDVDAGAAFNDADRLAIDPSNAALTAWLATFPGMYYLVVSRLTTSPASFQMGETAPYPFSMIDPDTPGATDAAGRYDELGRWQSSTTYAADVTVYYYVAVTDGTRIVARTSMQSATNTAGTAAAVATEDGELVISGVDDSATALVFTLDAPARYAGTYEIDLVAMAEGTPINLVPPSISGGPTGTLTLLPGLWAYDATAYAAASVLWAVQFEWLSDGATIADASGLTYVRASNGAITVRETVPTAPTGQVVSVDSAALPAIAAATTTIALGAPRPISLGSIFADTRTIAFATQVTFAGLAATQRILSRNSASTNAPGVQVTTSGNIQIISGGASVSNITTSAPSIATSSALKVTIAASADLDRYGAATNRNTIYASSSAAAASRVGADATAHGGSLRLNPAGSLFAAPNSPDWDQPFSGIIHEWVWITDAAIPAEALRDALFIADPTDPTGWAPRALPSDGAVVIGAATVTPKVFIRGANFGQTEGPPGTWTVPNYGSAGGTLTLLNGAFA